jgi:hypothetical protein
MKNQPEGAPKARKTRRNKAAGSKAGVAEAHSKRALRKYCREHGWHVAFFESGSGASGMGIIDAVAYRVGKQNPDEMDLRLIQLKGAKSGVTAEEIRRLKEAAETLRRDFVIAEFDGKSLQFLPHAPD